MAVASIINVAQRNNDNKQRLTLTRCVNSSLVLATIGANNKEHNKIIAVIKTTKLANLTISPVAANDSYTA